MTEPQDAVPASLAGRRLGHYLVGQELGRGGMGVVYRAKDTRLDRDVAIKVLRRDLGLDAPHHVRLEREARAAAGLVHSGIATVFALEHADDETFIVTEYVEGSTLRALIEEGPLPRARLAEVALDIARGLAAAHAGGIVHRDLKPENVLLPLSGGAKIVDFGLARIEAPAGDRTTMLERLSRTGTVMGTPAYMAPEQIDGLVADFRADLFAFGVVLYEMATGRHPFAAGGLASTLANVVAAEPPPLSSGGDPWWNALDAIVRRCLEKSRDRRYSSTGRLVEDLEWLSAQAAEVRVLEVVDGESAGAGAELVRSARWWWNTHQVTVSVVNALALAPLWVALSQGAWPGSGRAVFLVGVAAAVVEVALRLHLAFVARFQDEALDRQRRRLRRPLAFATAIFLVTVLAGVVAAFPAQTGLAVVLLVVGTALLVSALVIEPATTRAALGPDPS
jgi:predicted Ser/Thr protein kinase